MAEALGGGELVEIVTAGDRGAPGGDKSRWVAELERALLDGRGRHRRALGQGRAGRAGGRARSSSRSPSARTRATSSSAPARSMTWRRARASAPRRCGEPPSCTPPARISRWWPCAATSTPGCASSPRASGTRSCSRWPGWSGSGRAGVAGQALEDFVPAPGQGALAVEARADDAPTREALSAIDHEPSHASLRCRARVHPRAGGELPHPGRGAGPRRRARGVRRAAGRVGVGARPREGDDPEALGREVAERMLAAGAGDLLRRAEAEVGGDS